MTPTPETTKPPEELSNTELQEKYATGLHDMETVRFPDDAPLEMKRDAAQLHAKMTGKFRELLLLNRNPGPDPLKTEQMVQGVRKEMADLYQAFLAKHDEAIRTATNKRLTYKAKDGTPAFVDRDIDTLFDEKNPFSKRLKDIMKALKRDAAYEKRYFLPFGRVDGANVMQDLKYVEDMEKLATVDQRAALESVKAALQQLAAMDPPGSKSEREDQIKHENYKSNPATSAFKMLAIAGGVFMTAWSAKEKNAKLLALYGGLTLYGINKNIFSGLDTRLLARFEDANTKQMQEYQKNYFSGPEGKAALLELFAMNGIEQKKLLAALIKGGSVSPLQAFELAGKNPKSPLYKTLASMPNDRERHQVLLHVRAFDDQYLQEFYTKYVEAEEAAKGTS